MKNFNYKYNNQLYQLLIFNIYIYIINYYFSKFACSGFIPYYIYYLYYFLKIFNN